MALQKKQYTPIEELSIKFTSWVGTPTSIVIHTFFFIGIFALQLFGFTLDSILLILTTLVSLEAIYLAIFIQMSINRNTESLEAVEEDVEEIAKDVDEIQEDVEDIEKDVEEIAKDVDEIQEDVQDIEEDVDEIAKDVDEIQEDEKEEEKQKQLFEKVESQLEIIMKEIHELKKKQK
jgi:septal ring factor EnvC (AmiA/AmiB activator)